jgi:NAD(P)-dependent dehydrogenase (short-subunit alcohol dehydrogenase family)
MNFRKSIVISGASSGFGAAVTRCLAQDGHNLYICARRADLLATVVHGYPSAFHARCDVGEEIEVKRFFQQIQERTSSIDALIHCAARLSPIGLFNEVNSDEWLSSLKTNLLGAFLMAKYAVPLMKFERRPRMIFVSGGGAFTPLPRASAYGVAKAAIVRLVETLALELEPRNIAVNAVAPGFLATDIHAETLAAGRERGGEHYDRTIKLLAESDEGMKIPVDCIRYMISEESAKLTGKTISARHDPWGEPEFNERIDEIMASMLYATHRITHFDKVGELADALKAAAKNAKRRRKVQR